MFTATFNPRNSSAVRMGFGVSRYPVVNAGRRLSAPAEPSPSVKAARASMCSLAREFQDLIDSNQPVGNRQLGDLERAFNEHMDNTIREGEHPLDTIDYLKKECGIRQNILNEIRPRLFWNNYTGLTAYGGTTAPPYVPPPPPPMVPSVDWPATLTPLPPLPPPPPPPNVPTGSEAEPMTTGLEPAPTPPSPPPPLPSPAPVTTPSVGCWYVMGKGYMWGSRPSGGESTGLNQRDCEAIRLRDLEVRTGQPQLMQQVSCDPLKGQFYDPRTGQCRGSVSSFPGAPFGLPGGSGAVSAPSLTGRRRRSYSDGNLEWWSYQQAFLPQLFFARRRTNVATLGVGKPVPPDLCCQATEDGGAICSNGQGFPPTCPNKPEPNVPGTAERIQQGGYLVPRPPLAPVNGACAAPDVTGDQSAGAPPLLGLAAVGALIYALVESL